MQKKDQIYLTDIWSFYIALRSVEVADNGVDGSFILNIKEKRWQEEMYNENEEIEKELTLSQYIDELDIPEEVLEDNVFGL